MIKGIYLDWNPENPRESSREYYDDVDLDDLDNISEFGKTREFWPASWGWLPEQRGRFVYYNVECCIRKCEEQIHIFVKYKREDNEDDTSDQNVKNKLNEIVWGTNKIIINEGERCGTCEWTPEGAPQPIIFDWKRKNLEEKGRQIRLTKQQVRDEKFRDMIIDLDKKCVVSGEATTKALDAAHIIPVKDKGTEIPENGIALRADIHRLYDAGAFAFNPESGKPEILDNQLSCEYKKILEQGCLHQTTHERVHSALPRKKAWI